MPCLRFLFLSLIILFSITSQTHTAFADDTAPAKKIKRQLLAGAFAIDITPKKFPVSMNGSMVDRQAVGAHDQLHARCLVLDDGTEKIAFVICDFCMVPREIFDAAKKKASQATGIPEKNILASATHTHTSVTVAGVFQSSTGEAEKEYIKFLIDQIAKGIEKAHDQRVPAKIGWGVGNNTRQVYNRRWHMRKRYPFEKIDPFGKGTDRVKMNPPPGASVLLKPAGPIDPEIPILAVQSIDGRPIAVLANYSLHYVGGVPGKLVSADYFGEFAKQFTKLVEAGQKAKTKKNASGKMEKKNAPPFVAMMTNGTSGNINNINFFEKRTRKQPFEQITLVAIDVASSAYSAYQRIEYHDDVPIRMVETEVDLGVRLPSEKDVARAKKILEEAKKKPYRKLDEIYARETMLVSKYPKTVRVKLQAVRIGDLGIVSSPCETFVETGLAIKKKSPFRTTFTIELANGYNGYLATPEHHQLGGYETWRARSSYVTPDAEPKVRKTLLELLHQLAK